MFERIIEKLLYGSRWLLAPIYLGLAVALIALGIKFFQKSWFIVTHAASLDEAELILRILTMIDVALVGSLLIMVMFSGYENFVSRIDIDDGNDKLGWLGKLDANTLKLKVAASIVAISSIHLLGIFMEAERIPNDKIMWYAILHGVFVVSAVLLGFLDKMAFAGHRDH